MLVRWRDSPDSLPSTTIGIRPTRTSLQNSTLCQIISSHGLGKPWLDVMVLRKRTCSRAARVGRDASEGSMVTISSVHWKSTAAACDVVCTATTISGKETACTPTCDCVSFSPGISGTALRPMQLLSACLSNAPSRLDQTCRT
jgi:hypothetical protein